MRQRAPALAPEERRQEIIAATLPLLGEHGANVTTSQIAQAAGIAEGTIFRVFQDKRELLLAALGAAVCADAEVGRIGQIGLNDPLEERLVAALAITSDYQDRLWSLIRVLRDTDLHTELHAEEKREHHPRHQMERLGAAMALLFGPEEHALRQSPPAAARMLLGLAFANRIQEPGVGEPALTPEEVVDLFLNGALADDGKEVRKQ